MASFITPGGNTINPDGSPADDTTNPTTTTTPGVNQSGLGGFLQNVGQTLTGSNNPLTNAMLVPAFATAAQQWHNAGQYTQLGNQAAQTANPFGDRSQYVNDLSNLERDPSQIANTPGYKFALNQAMDATSSKLASQGYLGSTQMQNALATQSSGLAQQTYNSTIEQLSKLAGAQFDPANAAQMQMRGGELAVNSQNAALAAMFAPFGANSGAATINNNNGGGGGNGNPNGNNNLQNSLSRAVASGAISGADASALFHRILTSQGNISDGDLNLMNHLGIQNPVDLGGEDVAPPTYDPTGGFGVDQTGINGSTNSILNSQNGSVFDTTNGGSGFNGNFTTDNSGLDLSTLFSG